MHQSSEELLTDEMKSRGGTFQATEASNKMRESRYERTAILEHLNKRVLGGHCMMMIMSSCLIWNFHAEVSSKRKHCHNTVEAAMRYRLNNFYWRSLVTNKQSSAQLFTKEIQNFQQR